MELGPSRQCTACQHYRGALETPAPDPDGEGQIIDAAEVYSCSAFPEGIPWEIINEAFDHREPFDGDNGVRFTAASRRGMEVVDRMTFGGIIR